MRQIFAFISIVISFQTFAQALRIPQNTNIACLTGRRVGVTDIEIRYNAPGVKGREGKIYGTKVVHYSPFFARTKTISLANFGTKIEF